MQRATLFFYLVTSSLRGLVMNMKVRNALKVGAASLCLALAAGCASQKALDDATAAANAATQAATAAQRAADSAKSSADGAASAAARAQSTADQAMSAASAAQACCDRNSEKIERMFKKAQSK